MKNKIGICVIGCGFIAGVHAKYLNSLNDVSLFFASRNINKAKDFCKRFKGAGFFGSYEEAAKDGRVNALLICTPHKEHFSGIKLGAKYKKHVLIEKPLALNLKEADKAISLAKRAGIVLMVAENYHFMPATLKVKELIGKGLIGKLRFCVVNCFKKSKPKGWRLRLDSAGGGVFIDVGIHFVDLLRNICGEVDSVFALRPKQSFLDMEGEDSISVLMKLKRCVGQINLSTAAPGPRFQCVSFIGSEGRILMENSGLFVILCGKKKRFFFTGRRDGNGFMAMHREFLNAIKKKRKPITDALSGKKTLKVVLAAYKSLKSGQCVNITK